MPSSITLSPKYTISLDFIRAARDQLKIEGGVIAAAVNQIPVLAKATAVPPRLLWVVEELTKWESARQMRTIEKNMITMSESRLRHMRIGAMLRGAAAVRNKGKMTQRQLKSKRSNTRTACSPHQLIAGLRRKNQDLKRELQMMKRVGQTGASR